jgi:cellulose 1,4-beta-cellobiosidase
VRDFYGPGMTVDTTKKMTVVTQFLKGSDGQLSEIKRYYVQGGKVIANAESAIEGNPGNSITAEYCRAQKVAFGDRDIFEEKGGMPQFSKALAAPMVLVMSLWDDHYANMLWLDSTYPTDASPDEPGKGRGTCDTSSGVPAEIEASQGNNQVVFCEFWPLHPSSMLGLLCPFQSC